MTKKTITIFLVALLLQLNLSAQNQQELYCWMNGTKIPVTKDLSAVTVQFEKGVNPATKFNNSDAVELNEIIFDNQDARAIITFKSGQLMEDSKIIERLELQNEDVKSIAPAYRLESGFEFWPTDQVVLQLKDNVSLDELNHILAKYDASYKRTDYGTTVLEVKDMNNSLYLANEIYESGLVKWAEIDFFAPIKTGDDPLKDLDFGTLFTPSDPLYSEQFQMNNTGQTIDGFAGGNDFDCNAPQAWDITKGSSTITVAVIDDGVEAHEDLGNVLSGYTPLNGGNGTPLSDGDHGQACAGIIAALHNNLGVAGLAPNVNILPINIFAGNETTQDLANAISWAAANGADVISNSWGYPNSCGASASNINSAIADAATNGRGGKGCIIVFASGNGYQSCVDYPAWLPEVIAVGAFGNDGVVSDYSNEGSDLDIVAPSNDINSFGFLTGAGVRTIDRMGSAGYDAGNYTTSFGGTSAACPVVSGVSALVLSVNPNLTLSEVKNILYSTAIDMGSPGFDNSYGNGRVNAFAAVQAAQGGNNQDTQAPTAPSNLVASNVTQSGVDLSWGASTDNVGVNGYNIYVNGSFFNSVSGTTATLTGLSSSTNYDIYVTASDAAANESAASNTESITTLSGGGGGTPVVLSGNSFETGWEDWNDGGSDCARVNSATNAWDGNFSIRIRDNSGTASAMTSDPFDLSSYGQVDVEFYFRPVGMENGEDFWLRYFDGSTWQTVATYAAGSSFDNGSFYVATVTLNAADYNFVSNARFRFQCDASVNNDRIYIDLVTITASGTAGTSSLVASGQSIFPMGVATLDAPNINNLRGDLDENQVVLYPNPVSDELNVDYAGEINTVRITNLQGQEIMRFEGTDSFDVSTLASGIYIIMIEGEGTIETKKFLKQ